LRPDTLIELSVIGLRHQIFAQGQGKVLGVGHRFDGTGVDLLHLLDQAENPGQLGQGDFGFRRRDFNARKMRDALHIGKR
jgi:hypothetical protein